MIRITDAELKVMEVIWKMKEVTSFEIISKLQDCKWNDNTIRTLIKRLVAKKAVGISKKEGRVYSYVPLLDEKVYKVKVAIQFINQIHKGSIRNMLISFIKAGELTRNDLQEVLKLVDKKEKSKKEKSKK